MASERRRYIRLTTDQNVQCSIAGIDVVHVVGLGSGGSGMRLITNRELPDEEFELTLDLDDGKEPLLLKGKAVWQESWNFDFFDRHAAGISLSGLTEEASQRIDTLIQNPTAEVDPSQDLP